MASLKGFCGSSFDCNGNFREFASTRSLLESINEFELLPSSLFSLAVLKNLCQVDS